MRFEAEGRSLAILRAALRFQRSTFVTLAGKGGSIGSSVREEFVSDCVGSCLYPVGLFSYFFEQHREAVDFLLQLQSLKEVGIFLGREAEDPPALRNRVEFLRHMESVSFEVNIGPRRPAAKRQSAPFPPALRAALHDSLLPSPAQFVGTPGNKVRDHLTMV